jgi:hypothetical protein
VCRLIAKVRLGVVSSRVARTEGGTQRNGGRRLYVGPRAIGKMAPTRSWVDGLRERAPRDFAPALKLPDPRLPRVETEAVRIPEEVDSDSFWRHLRSTTKTASPRERPFVIAVSAYSSSASKWKNTPFCS